MKQFQVISKEKADKVLKILQGQIDYYTSQCGNSSYENLASFNDKRVIFITEQSNVAGISRVAPKARLIVENNNYTEQLKTNILKAFDLLF